ncbi:MAG: hypothetical protein K5929_08525 [Lachnospiraceae bacterium]|nr:hypothetical protein [Lachnospiraceae bacterium]
MLGKCLKHEWVETWFIGLACCASVILVSVLIMFILPTFPKLADSDVGVYVLPILILTLTIIGIAAVAGALFIGKYFFFYRYYKNLFTDQGYLMHTLPVETQDLVHSKLIVALIWQYLLAISYGVAIFFGSIGVYGLFNDDFTDYYDFLNGLREVFGFVFDVGKPEIALFALCMLLYPIMDMLFCFLAVAIGQLGKKNRFVLAICALVGISFVQRFAMNIVSAVSAVLNIFFGINFRMDTVEDVTAQYDIMLVLFLIIEVVAIVGAYLWNMHLVKNKLNLE